MQGPKFLYILDEQKEPVQESDIAKWGEWMANDEKRVVARTSVGEAIVSTVFLGLDPMVILGGEPVLFETLIFGSDFDGMRSKSATWAQAELVHKGVVETVRRDRLLRTPGGET